MTLNGVTRGVAIVYAVVTGIVRKGWIIFRQESM